MSGNKSNIIFLVVGIVVIVLVIAYYVNHVFNQVKSKMFLPTQQKLAALEANVKEVEQRVVAGTRQKKDDLSLVSASYRSDGSKHGNMSLVYGDLSEGAAAEILDQVARGQGHIVDNRVRTPETGGARKTGRPGTQNIFEEPETRGGSQATMSNSRGSPNLFGESRSRRGQRGNSDVNLFDVSDADRHSEQRTPSNIFDDPLDVEGLSATSISSTSSSKHRVQNSAQPTQSVTVPDDRSVSSQQSSRGLVINQQVAKSISDNLRRTASDRSLSPLSAVIASPSPRAS